MTQELGLESPVLTVPSRDGIETKNRSLELRIHPPT